MILLESPMPAKSLLLSLIELLEDKCLILSQLKEIRVSSTGSSGFQGICKLPVEGARARRLDLHLYPASARAFAELYYTGPPAFLRWIRDQAASKGLALSDCSLVATAEAPPAEVERLRAFEPIGKEEAIFEAIGIEYVRPEERGEVVGELGQKEEGKIKEASDIML